VPPVTPATGGAHIIAAAGPQRVENATRPSDHRGNGVPGFSTGAWWGLFGPANLPPAIFNKIRTETARLLGTPEVLKVFETNTMELIDMTPEQFNAVHSR
jgi:tripartite-type tricarboxylate transporter receptor subunit TctC